MSDSPAAASAVGFAVLTVSDTRTEATDTSGGLLAERIKAAGHRLVHKQILPDDRYRIRAIVSNWIVDPAVQVVVSTGGTGLTGRDVMVEAVRPLFDKEIEGFGEVFRWLSFEEIRTSTVQSRAIGGVANGTYIFCLPGSTGACRLVSDAIHTHQFDATHRPCNMIEILPRLRERSG